MKVWRSKKFIGCLVGVTILSVCLQPWLAGRLRTYAVRWLTHRYHGQSRPVSDLAGNKNFILQNLKGEIFNYSFEVDQCYFSWNGRFGPQICPTTMRFDHLRIYMHSVDYSGLNWRQRKQAQYRLKLGMALAKWLTKPLQSVTCDTLSFGANSVGARLENFESFFADPRQKQAGLHLKKLSAEKVILYSPSELETLKRHLNVKVTQSLPDCMSLLQAAPAPFSKEGHLYPLKSLRLPIESINIGSLAFAKKNPAGPIRITGHCKGTLGDLILAFRMEGFSNQVIAEGLFSGPMTDPLNTKLELTASYKQQTCQMELQLHPTKPCALRLVAPDIFSMKSAFNLSGLKTMQTFLQFDPKLRGRTAHSAFFATGELGKRVNLKLVGKTWTGLNDAWEGDLQGLLGGEATDLIATCTQPSVEGGLLRLHGSVKGRWKNDAFIRVECMGVRQANTVMQGEAEVYPSGKLVLHIDEEGLLFGGTPVEGLAAYHAPKIDTQGQIKFNWQKGFDPGQLSMRLGDYALYCLSEPALSGSKGQIRLGSYAEVEAPLLEATWNDQALPKTWDLALRLPAHRFIKSLDQIRMHAKGGYGLTIPIELDLHLESNYLGQNKTPLSGHITSRLNFSFGEMCNPVQGGLKEATVEIGAQLKEGQASILTLSEPLTLCYQGESQKWKLSPANLLTTSAGAVTIIKAEGRALENGTINIGFISENLQPLIKTLWPQLAFTGNVNTHLCIDWDLPSKGVEAELRLQSRIDQPLVYTHGELSAEVALTQLIATLNYANKRVNLGCKVFGGVEGQEALWIDAQGALATAADLKIEAEINLNEALGRVKYANRLEGNILSNGKWKIFGSPSALKMTGDGSFKIMDLFDVPLLAKLKSEGQSLSMQLSAVRNELPILDGLAEWNWLKFPWDFKAHSGTSGRFSLSPVALEAVSSLKILGLSGQAETKLLPNVQIVWDGDRLHGQGEINLSKLKVSMAKIGALPILTEKSILSSDERIKEGSRTTNASAIDWDQWSKAHLGNWNIALQLGEEVNLEAFSGVFNFAGKVVLKNERKGSALYLSGGIGLNNTYESKAAKKAELSLYGQRLFIRKGLVQFKDTMSAANIIVDAIRDPNRTEDGVIAGVRITGLLPQSVNVNLFTEPIEQSPDQALAYFMYGRALNAREQSSEDHLYSLIAFAVDQSFRPIIQSMALALQAVRGFSWVKYIELQPLYVDYSLETPFLAIAAKILQSSYEVTLNVPFNGWPTFDSSSSMIWKIKGMLYKHLGLELSVSNLLKGSAVPSMSGFLTCRISI